MRQAIPFFRRIRWLRGIISSLHAASSELPSGMRQQIASNGMRMNFGQLRKPANVVGFKVSYFGEEQLRHMFDQIFVEDFLIVSLKCKKPLIIDRGSNIRLSILFFK
jgi:hypothetical protein